LTAIRLALSSPRRFTTELPAPITDRVKKSILDTIGIIMPAGELMPDLKPAIDLYIEAAARRRAPSWYGVKLPCWAATLPTGSGGTRSTMPDGHLEGRLFRSGSV